MLVNKAYTSIILYRNKSFCPIIPKRLMFKSRPNRIKTIMYRFHSYQAVLD